MQKDIKANKPVLKPYLLQNENSDNKSNNNINENNIKQHDQK